MRRWIFNAGRWSIRVHHWLSSDDHRAFHDHPWKFTTLVIRGGYTDVSDDGRERMTAGIMKTRQATHRHTVEVDEGGCWTIMVAGPEIRRWGFWPKGKFMKTNKYFLNFGHHPCIDGR